MTKSMLTKTIFGQGLVQLAILTMVVLLVPGGLFAQSETIAEPDFAITPPNTPVTINVIANDTAGNGTFDLDKIKSTKDPSHGTVEYNDDGTFTYTPDQDFSSTVPDTFDYEACDTATQPSCATATVSIIVAIEAPLNVIPRKLNVKQNGVLPVVIQSSEDFDVTTIDPGLLMLQGASPVRWNMLGKKLILKFRAKDIVSNLGPVNDRDVVVLQLTGEDINGKAIVGEDSVIIINKGKPKK